MAFCVRDTTAQCINSVEKQKIYGNLWKNLKEISKNKRKLLIFNKGLEKQRQLEIVF